MKSKHKQPKVEWKAANWAALVVLALGLGGVVYWNLRRPDSSPAPAAISPTEASAESSERPLPYHESEEAAKPFPATLPPTYFRNPHVARAYRVARQIPGILAQQPCYCYCDRYGHGSLLDCYKSDHGAG